MRARIILATIATVIVLAINWYGDHHKLDERPVHAHDETHSVSLP